MTKIRMTEELLSIIHAIAEVFQWTVETRWDEKGCLQEVDLFGRHGHARDIIFRFNEIDEDGCGEAEIFIRRRGDNEEEESMNEFIQFSDPQEFKEAVERLYERGPNGLSWYEYRFGKSHTNCWYDDVLNIV